MEVLPMSIKAVLYDEGEFRSYMGKAEFDKALTTLLGIIQGVSFDGVISDAEAIEIANWITLHENLARYQPFSELIPLAKEALADGEIDAEELQDIIWVLRQFDEGSKYYSLITLVMQVLQGIFHGILSDDQISDIEVQRLSDWIDDNVVLKGTYPYDELESIIKSILADGNISQREKGQLKAFMGDFIDCTKSYNLSQNDLNELKTEFQIDGLCSTNPKVIVKDHLFCFTGKSSRCTRAEIEQAVASCEGIYNDSVTKDTHYLVIGNDGNSCWSFSCYGRKVEKAMQMRKKGHPIIIVHENDFWSCISQH
jgi:hypothetical protein